ncbi:hypothetical protein GCM10010145_52410 [Streptomyces ruber]|uniref:Uncharacterized protein n=2 Tax=Streptomyces TaxID=1883 RepID=A0A918BNB9_9ACTN|nr:hypothetical protein GCM10010145_52410 [Streptomyces ruber]
MASWFSDMGILPDQAGHGAGWVPVAAVVRERDAGAVASASARGHMPVGDRRGGAAYEPCRDERLRGLRHGRRRERRDTTKAIASSPAVLKSRVPWRVPEQILRLTESKSRSGPIPQSVDMAALVRRLRAPSNPRIGEPT